MKIINKNKIRTKYREEHLVPIDEKILDNLVNYSIMQTEMMKLLEEIIEEYLCDHGKENISYPTESKH